MRLWATRRCSCLTVLEVILPAPGGVNMSVSGQNNLKVPLDIHSLRDSWRGVHASDRTCDLSPRARGTLSP
jgi:hypothetical protein